MSQKEAQDLISEKVGKYREKRYEDLVEMIKQKPERYELTGPSGTEYFIEIEAFWDDKPNGDIRVIGSIDEQPNKPIFADKPLLRWIPIYSSTATDDFILSPSGKFIDE